MWSVFNLVPVHPSYGTQPKSNVFPYKCSRSTFVLVRCLSQSDVCTSPTFVSVRRLYQSDVCTSPTLVPVRLLSQSVVCTSPTFVPVRLLSQSEVCTSPTFVSPTFELSDICSFRRLWVRCLYWYLQFRTNFYPLMQKINSVNKLKVLILIIKKLMIKIIWLAQNQVLV